MADQVLNIGLGRVIEKAADGDTLELLVLQASDSDAAMKDVDTVADLLALGGVTEANFTNYTRQTLTGVTVTVDDTADDASVDCDDVSFTSAGNGTNNTTTHAFVYEDVDGTDANAVPLLQYDAVFTTDGNDVTLQINADGLIVVS